MNKYYKAKIIKVDPGSIAALNSIEPGDYLLAVDQQALKDLLDYQFAIYDTQELDFLIEKPDTTQKTIKLLKKPDEDPGLTFESAVFDNLRLCNNRCIFCFVDQQPEGLRESLYVKDDDYRLSYLQGTYITLTNLTSSDKERIERLRLGPLYVSVHTTNPEIRVKMLNNRLAADINEKLAWLEELFIPVHAQIVVCPGFNDSEELRNTLTDLSDFENVLSVAIVPAGITKYRKDDILLPFDKSKALETLAIVSQINKARGEAFAIPSDEIYLLANEDIPEEAFYGNFSQLEDGVGMARLILDQFESISLPEKLDSNRHIGIITASLGAQILHKAFKKLSNIENLKLDIIEINNKFWGDRVSVCGLIVGSDIIDTLKNINPLPPEIFLPSVMLRKFSNEFIDGVTIENIEQQFDTKIHIVENPYSLEELINTLTENCPEL